MKKYVKACLVVAFSVMFVVETFAQVGPKFQAFLNRINAADQSLHSTIVDSFWATIPSFPLVEQNTIACFLYRGTANSVQVRVEKGNLPGFSLNRLQNTDLWYNYRIYEPDALIAYEFLVDDQKILDPNNPNVFAPTNANILKMPAYQDPPEIEYYPEIPHGSVQDVSVNSENLKRSLKVTMYTPPSYDANSDERYPLIVFNRGGFYSINLSAINVLDYLIAEKRIAPHIAAFVFPGNSNEYFNDPFYRNQAAFLSDELLPYIDARYKILDGPKNRALIGVGESGLFAIYVSYTRPHIFGVCAAQSPAFDLWENKVALYESLLKTPKDIHFYLSWGIYAPHLKRFMEPLIDGLIALGYDTLSWDVWNEGNYTPGFGGHIDDALIYVDYITAVETEASIPTAFQLEQNYPNPFNPSTTIGFSLPNISKVTLKIYDLLGREVATLLDAPYPAGNHQIIWDAKNQATGVYMVTMHAGDFRQTRKILLMK